MLIAINRNIRFFEAARHVAQHSDFYIKVGAVAVYKGKVIASASSSQKTHPLQCRYNHFRDFVHEGLVFDKVHAEISLLTKLKKLDVFHKDAGQIDIYVYRICKCREHGIARPCSGCMQALLDSGITHVYYSTDVGFAYEEFESGCSIRKRDVA